MDPWGAQAHDPGRVPPPKQARQLKLSIRENAMNRDGMHQAVYALCTVSVLGMAASALGAAADQEQASAAAAGLSPQDRCAIAKLEATSREAECLADAQIEGIRRDLTDQQVNR